MPGACLAHPFEITGCRMNRARIAHGGFHDDARDVAFGQPLPDQLQIVPGQDNEIVGRLRNLAFAAATATGASAGPAASSAGAVDQRTLSNQP